MTLKNLITGTALALVAFTAHAHEFKLGAITIGHPYARATAAGQPTGGAFMKFVNAGGNDKLLSVSAEVSKSVELHEMKMEGDVMKMAAVAGLELPAGKAVELKPGGFHVMLMDLKQTMKAGDTVPLTLVVEGLDGKRETLKIKVPVRALAAQPMEPKH